MTVNRDLWPAILAMAVATYLSRSLTLALFPGLPLPGPLLRGLRYVPAGILAALVAPALLTPGGHLALPWENPDLLAGVVAGVAAIRTRNSLLTMLSGVGAALLFRRLLPF